MTQRYKAKSQPEILTVEMPDGKEVGFYLIKSMPIGNSEAFFATHRTGNKDTVITDQLFSLMVEPDREYIRRNITMEDANAILGLLSDGLHLPEKKTESGQDIPITSSPASAETI